MIFLNHVQSEDRVTISEFSIMTPNMSVTVDGHTTNLTNNPKDFNLKIAHVSFGRSTETRFCTWAQTTYKKEAFSDYGGDQGDKLTELLNIEWYKADMVHVDNEQTIYKQGYIVGNIDHPITLRFDKNGNNDIGYLYGDIIPAESIIKGLIGSDVTPIKHWWNYIVTLLERKIFDNKTKELIERHLLGVFEKNEFNIKG